MNIQKLIDDATGATGRSATCAGGPTAPTPPLSRVRPPGESFLCPHLTRPVMPMPRFRFTVRWLMVAVAIVAVLISIESRLVPGRSTS